jgi:SAM-dependent methyltransferase
MENKMSERAREAWGSGGPYELYVGRWSRKVASEFLAWLGVSSSQTWADVGCGTGALVDGILATAEPQAILAIDRSKGFVAAARSSIPDQRVRLVVAEATALPWASASCAAAVSGLVLNFVPDAAAMVREMVRVTRPSGQVAAYVWDYGGGMEMMRHFWDAAVEVSPADAALDEAERFPLCQPEPLKALFRDVGLTAVAVRSIAVPTVFRDFDDYWTPFLGKQGPAPTYVTSLDRETRDRLREILRARLVAAADGSITLTAQAWAVQGIV